MRWLWLSGQECIGNNWGAAPKTGMQVHIFLMAGEEVVREIQQEFGRCGFGCALVFETPLLSFSGSFIFIFIFIFLYLFWVFSIIRGLPLFLEDGLPIYTSILSVLISTLQKVTLNGKLIYEYMIWWLWLQITFMSDLCLTT